MGQSWTDMDLRKAVFKYAEIAEQQSKVGKNYTDSFRKSNPSSLCRVRAISPPSLPICRTFCSNVNWLDWKVVLEFLIWLANYQINLILPYFFSMTLIPMIQYWWLHRLLHNANCPPVSHPFRRGIRSMDRACPTYIHRSA